jgi:membrane-associated phospholipid phosphatase
MNKKLTLLILLIALVGLVASLTIYDLPISQALYSQHNLFGRFFEAFGELPGFLIGAFCFAALYELRGRRNKLIRTAVGIGFGIAVVLICFIAIVNTAAYLDLAYSALLSTIAVVVAGLLWFLAKQAAKTQPEALWRAALVGTILFVLTGLLVNTIKIEWGRERYRSMTDPADQFTTWYEIQTRSIDNEYKSFPSGHSATAAVTLWITLLPTFIPGLKGREILLAAIAGLWTLLVMLSRIIVGAHFATDTLAGFLLTLFLFMLLTYLTRPHNLH